MQKLIIKNKYQSPNRVNILAAAGIAQINEPIFPQNGERIFGKSGVVTFNQASQYNEDDSPNDPINPPDCPNCGGGIEPEPSVQPDANCDKKNISELKQILDDYANQSFCDKEFPEVQFSTFIGYDKPPSDSTAKEIELRMLCPVDDCDPKYYTNLRFGLTYECLDSVEDYSIEQDCVEVSVKEALSIANSQREKALTMFKGCFQNSEIPFNLLEPFTEENCRITKKEPQYQCKGELRIQFPITSLSKSFICNKNTCPECYKENKQYCAYLYMTFSCGYPSFSCVCG